MGTQGRVLIFNDQREFARLIGMVAERIGLAARILPHALDFKYVLAHWRPDFIAVHMGMPDQQDVEVLEYLEEIRFSGSLLLTGDVKRTALSEAADVARARGLTVVSVLTTRAVKTEIETILKRLMAIEDAA